MTRSPSAHSSYCTERQPADMNTKPANTNCRPVRLYAKRQLMEIINNLQGSSAMRPPLWACATQMADPNIADQNVYLAKPYQRGILRWRNEAFLAHHVLSLPFRGTVP